MSRPWRRRSRPSTSRRSARARRRRARAGRYLGLGHRDVLGAHRLRHAGVRGARHGGDAGLGDRRARDGPVRLRRGAHRRVAARPGPAHHAVADHRRRARHLAGPHQDRARRHRPHALWLGHLREPLAGDRRRRDPAGGAQGARQAGRRWPASCWRPRRTTSCSKPTWRASPAPTGRSRSRRWRAPRITRPTGSRATITPGLAESATYDPPGTFSNACHVAMVEVDVETGGVGIERFLVAEDAGRLINPMIVDGQIHGGVAQGIANALLEEIVYDETGNILTATLADYLPPTAREMPPIEIHHLETLTSASDHPGQGPGRGRRDRRAGRRGQCDQRRAVAVRRVDRRVSGDAAAHPRGVARGARVRDGRPDMSVRRPLGSAPRGPAPGHRPRPLRGRHLVSAHAAHAGGALRPRARPHRVDRHDARRWPLPGVVAVWTFADVADIPPIDFRLTRIEGLAPYRQTDPGAAARALCRRSGRGGVRDRSLSGRGRRRPGRRSRSRNCRVLLDASAPPGEFDAGRSTEAGGGGEILRRRRGGVPRRARRGRARPRDRAAFRRADGNARRHRALRRGARRAGAARRRQGAALEPRQHRPHARPRAVDGASVRGPCRRRLRHSRRALSRGRAGVRRGAAARPAGEMDRGPARAPDRRQPFAPAAPPGPRRGRCATAAFSRSTTSSSTTRAAMCAPTRPPCPISPPPCCPGPIACRPIGRSATSG